MTVAEVIAASLCWLARFKITRATNAEGPARAQAKVESYWHARPCRFCPVYRDGKLVSGFEPVELMARINAERARPGWAAQEQAFNRLERKARTAKVREAQEEPWYEQATR